MKRFFLIFLCMALLGSLFIPALGEAMDARMIYVRVPSSWDTVYLLPNGENSRISKTGTEMTLRDGQYCLNIPDELTEFTLFSGAKEASKPISTTPDLDLYVTVDEDGTAHVDCIGFEETPALLSLTEQDYCLVGYIQDRDYGFNDDYMNIGEYIFVNGTLTATFPSDSYIFVKTTDNEHWYLTNEYCTDTSAVFIEDSRQKMFVPGNVEVTFTLKELDSKRISLSYKLTNEETVTTTTTPPTEATTEATEPDETVPTRLLTITPPETWSNIHIYTWDPKEYGNFPGIPVEKDGDVYKATLKNTVRNLVISGYSNGKQIQTGDIFLVDNDKDIAIEVMKNRAYTIAYTGDMAARKAAAADITGIESSYRVSGSTDWLGNWNAKTELGIMTEINPGTYRKNYDNVPAGRYELKITKDGTWNEAYGDSEGKNFFFKLDGTSSITIDLIIKDGIARIDAYGSGIVLTSNSRTSSNSGSTDVTEPVETTPTVSEPDVTEPVSTEPDITSSTETKPVNTEPDASEPDIPTVPTDVTEPTEPATTAPNDGPDSMLSNQSFGDMRLFLFGVISACIYLVYLLIKKNSVSGDITPEGKVLRRKQLSKTEVENAVKENMPTPSDKLDQSVMEAIQKVKRPPTES